jgi:Tol biopolymer transport system component
MVLPCEEGALGAACEDRFRHRRWGSGAGAGTVGVLALLAANSGSGGDPAGPTGTTPALLDSYAQGVVSGYTYDLYVRNADGSGVRRLTRLAGRTRPQPRHQRSVDQAAPLWSRDGRLIYFTVTSPEKHAGDSEVGSPSFRRGKAYEVNSTGAPHVRRADAPRATRSTTTTGRTNVRHARPGTTSLPSTAPWTPTSEQAAASAWWGSSASRRPQVSRRR